MKKNYVILSAFVMAVGVFSFQKSGSEKIEMFKKHNLYPTGIGAGYAGAPGDANCTQCHSGNTQNGAAVNTLTFLSGTTPVTEYTPGETYNVALTMSPAPSTRGFQAVAKVGSTSSTAAGSFAAIGGAGAQVMSGRATHISNSGSALWAWNWTAPSSNVGLVTFYVASMSSSGNGTSGDVVYLSQHTINSTAGLNEEVADKYNFSAGYSANQNAVIMDFNSLVAGSMYFNLVDMSGRSVFTYQMGDAQIGANNEKIVLPTDLKEGMYVVNMFVNNNAMSQKIMIQK